MTDIIQQFRNAIAASGLTPPKEIIPGTKKFQRFSTNGNKNDTSGFYRLHLDGIPSGSFGCHRAAMTKTWCSKSLNEMTPDERTAHKKVLESMTKQREEDAEFKASEAAVEAQERWIKARPADDNHLYLTARGVKSYGLKVEGDNLLLQIYSLASKATTSLQTISPSGEKRFMAGGVKKAGFFQITSQNSPKDKAVICEGYATGASIFEATGLTVAVAFDAGNLLPVADAIRAIRPDIKLIIAADDDWNNDINTGAIKAKEAAEKVGGYLAVPNFSKNRSDRDSDFNDLHQTAGLDAVKECIDHALDSPASFASDAGATVQLSNWSEPKEIKSDIPLAPDFDSKTLLPASLSDFVLDEADRMPCPPDYIAAALIVCLGSVIGARCAIKPKRRDDWIVTPNLFGGMVGDPSSKKSPALGTVTRFLDRLQAKEAEKLENAKKIFDAEKAAFEAHQSAVKASMKKAASGKGDHLKMNAAIADLQDLQAPEEPKERRFKSNDSTVEKLGDLLVHNHQGMLVYRDELIGLLASWEKEGKEGDKAFYLEGWNGTASFNIDRIGRGSLHIKNLCISVFGGIQPDLLERYLAGITTALDNDGRIQRFQVMVYPNPVPWEWRDRYPVKGAREAVLDMFDRLAVFDPVQDGAAPSDDFVKLPHFCFDDAAQDIFIEWCTELHTVHIANEQNPLMKQHFGKFEKLFCSIALIFHLAEGSVGPITATSALRAAAWCEYLAGHARRIYGLVEAAKVSTARMVSRRLTEGKLIDGFTARDLIRKQWTGVTTSLQAETVLAILEENGHVQSQDCIINIGRPTVRYYVNPQIKKVA